MKAKLGFFPGLLILLLLMVPIGRSFAAENWQQFFYWNGADPTDGAKFPLGVRLYEQWQIRWHYDPKPSSSYYLTFIVYMISGDSYVLYERVTTRGSLEARHVFTSPPRQFMVELDLENIEYLEFWGEENLVYTQEPPEPSTLLFGLFFAAAVLIAVVIVVLILHRQKRSFF